MRERVENLFEDVRVETLYGISALGTKLCIYTASKETGRLLPRVVPANPGFVMERAPINRWDVDIMTSDEEQRLRMGSKDCVEYTVAEVKTVCA